jgi:hypothetical protein
VSWKYVAFRFDQMVMIGRLREGANTGRIGPFAQATEGAIWSNPQGGPKRGDRRVAESGPYPRYGPDSAPCAHPVSARPNATYFQLTTLGISTSDFVANLGKLTAFFAPVA